jgi:hypothetical protein
MALNDCKPDVTLRRMLLHQVLASYQDMCLDLESLTVGEKNSHQVIFEDDNQEKDSASLGQASMIRRQIQLQEDAMTYSLQDSIQHLASKTPIKWTYYNSSIANEASRSRPSTANRDAAAAKSLKKK